MNNIRLEFGKIIIKRNILTLTSEIQSGRWTPNISKYKKKRVRGSMGRRGWECTWDLDLLQVEQEVGEGIFGGEYLAKIWWTTWKSRCPRGACHWTTEVLTPKQVEGYRKSLVSPWRRTFLVCKSFMTKWEE